MRLEIFFTIILIAASACFTGCNQKNRELDQKIIFIKVPPVRDEKMSQEERYWQFRKVLFPQTEIPNPIPNGLPNDDSLFYVSLEEDKSIEINSIKITNLSNVQALQNQLAEFFQQRTKLGVFEESSNKIVKAVLIIAPDSAKYGDVFEVIEAVEKSGADPIVLKIKELPTAEVIIREMKL